MADRVQIQYRYHRPHPVPAPRGLLTTPKNSKYKFGGHNSTLPEDGHCQSRGADRLYSIMFERDKRYVQCSTVTKIFGHHFKVCVCVCTSASHNLQYTTTYTQVRYKFFENINMYRSGLHTSFQKH